MAVTIHVNGTSNSLVHKGSSGIAKNTVPDVCKTPSPGGPVPIPYPVIISKSGDLKKGTTTVKVDGNKMAAVKGSEFASCVGDEAGTAKGVKSNTNMKEATWILYSFDVKLDGKNACRLSDKMQMNHGNTVCLGGETQASVSGSGKPMLECGEVGTYGQLKKKRAAPDFERDHVPSKAALLQNAKNKAPGMTGAELKCVKNKLTSRGMAIAIPKSAHRGFSPTCGGRNTPAQISGDAKDLSGAIDRDTAAMQSHLDATNPACAAAYKEAVEKVKNHDNDSMIDNAINECMG